MLQANILIFLFTPRFVHVRIAARSSPSRPSKGQRFHDRHLHLHVVLRGMSSPNQCTYRRCSRSKPKRYARCHAHLLLPRYVKDYGPKNRCHLYYECTPLILNEVIDSWNRCNSLSCAAGTDGRSSRPYFHFSRWSASRTIRRYILCFSSPPRPLVYSVYSQI